MAELSAEVATFVEGQMAWWRTFASVCAGTGGAVTGAVIVGTVRLIRQQWRAGGSTNWWSGRDQAGQHDRLPELVTGQCA